MTPCGCVKPYLKQISCMIIHCIWMKLHLYVFPCFIWYIICVLRRSSMYNHFENTKDYAPCEARTHDLQIMRLTRCLLRQRGLETNLTHPYFGLTMVLSRVTKGNTISNLGERPCPFRWLNQYHVCSRSIDGLKNENVDVFSRCYS